MKHVRALTLFVGGLCWAGTAIGQTNPLRPKESSSLRLTRLEEPSAPSATQPGNNGGTSRQEPTVGGPINDYAAPPEAVATPEANDGGSYEDALHGDGYCDDCLSCLPSYCGGSNWYGYVGGLTMGRNMPNRFWTTYEAGNNPNQLQYFPGADWGGGVDTRLGYWFGCADGCGSGGGCGSCGPRVGVEAVYWGVWGLDGQSSLYSPTDQLSTPINLGFVGIGGEPAFEFFDNARQHQLTRNDEVHNVEVNFLVAPCCDPCRRFQMNFLAGVRYLRFTEDLQFATLSGNAPEGAVIGEDPLDEAYLNVDVQNNLIGFQIGSYVNYQIANRFSIFAIPKVGIFGNHVTAHSSLYRGDGAAGTFTDTGNQFDLRDSADSFSVLASIDVGVNWQFHNNWGIIAGYRVVGVSGMALSDDQIPAFLTAEQDWRDIETNGDLILHGAFAGIEARF